jgi:hypothetical protein
MSVQLVDDADVGYAAAFIAFTNIRRDEPFDEKFYQGIAASLAEDIAQWNIRSLKARYPEETYPDDRWSPEEERAHLDSCADHARKVLKLFAQNGDRLWSPSPLTLDVLKDASDSIDHIEYNSANARGFRDSNTARRLLEARRPLLRMMIRSINRRSAA